MQSSTFAYLSIVFIVIAAGMLLSAGTKWYRLLRRFPNSGEKALLTLNFLSGRMGFVNLKHCMHLSCCASGIRIALFRAFGPFSKPFFVPWAQLKVSRDTSIWGEVAVLKFGQPVIGTLIIPGHVADRFSQIVKGSWPEVRSADQGLTRKAFDRSSDFVEVLGYWLVSAFLITVVFAVGNLLAAQGDDVPMKWAEFSISGIGGFVIVLRKYSRKKG